jgi:hypothetical protein
MLRFVAALAALVLPSAVALACSRTGLDVPLVPETDSAVPPIGTVTPKASSPLCADAGTLDVYVVTEQNRLLRFDATSGQFSVLATLLCPDSRHAFSMAVDRRGIAYVLYAEGIAPGGGSGSLFRVDLATGACQTTAFTPQTGAFDTFGMGFAANEGDPGETLYVAGNAQPELGALDTTTYALAVRGALPPEVRQAELTGTGGGDLFGFYALDAGSAIARIDPAHATVLARDPLPDVTQGYAWAFAFWGGDFYLFTSPDGFATTVTRYRPRDGSRVVVATYPELIVGAGVSTCAPQ